jgi:hypothetical protein
MEVRPFWGDEDAEGQIRRLDAELTEAPRTAHRVRSRTAPRAGPLRDEFLIKIQAMDGVDPEVIRTLVEERLSWARGKLARYEGVRDRFLDGRTEERYLADADRIGPYLTLLGGIALEAETVRWCERALVVLKRRAPLS